MKRLQPIGVRTLVLDEAHHLRNEWWKCLTDLNKHLDKPAVVALTATAPFDVSPFEWDRYIGLCGPIDSEISVPEMVARKNLCPHQDYVYLSAPLQAEQQEIREFRREVEAFLQELCANQEFIAALESCPFVSRPRDCVEEILDDPPFYSSVAFFLNHVRGHPPRELLQTLGLSPRECRRVGCAHRSASTGAKHGGHSPPYDWLAILLAGCFYTHAKSFTAHKDLFHRLLRDAKRVGVVDRRSVSLKSSTRVARLFIRSISKLRSIENIVRLESETLGPDLDGCCPGRVQVLGVEGIREREVQRDFVTRYRRNCALRGDRGPRANPGLRAAVAREVIHLHEMNPGRRDRPPDFDSVADDEARSVVHREGRRPGRYVGVGNKRLGSIEFPPGGWADPDQ